MSDDNIKREEWNGHMDHIRTSLHDLRNSMAEVSQIREDVGIIKVEIRNVKEEQREIEKTAIAHDRDLQKLNTNNKWLAAIFTFFQGILFVLVAYFLKAQ